MNSLPPSRVHAAHDACMVDRPRDEHTDAGGDHLGGSPGRAGYSRTRTSNSSFIVPMTASAPSRSNCSHFPASFA